jgi:hypothetical protein
MASHLARILGVLGDPEPFGVRRATAFGYLANPVRVFELLQRYQQALEDGSVEPADPDEGEGPPAPGEPYEPDDAEDPVRESDVHPAQNDADDPDLEPCPCCSGLGRLDPAAAKNPHAFVKTLTGLDKLDWKKLLPQVTLYVHTTRESLLHPEDGGVARIEGIGPITLGQVGDFFGGGCHVTVKEVVDLAGVAPEDAYEASARMREAACLAHPGDAFPYAGCTGRSMDLDHVIPYLPPEDGGPPGQTHLGGLVRMTRFHHRIKTHSAWQVRHPEVGVVLWRSPHGFYWQVVGAGTHRLTQQAGQAYWDACSGRPTADVVPLHALRNAICGIGARAPDSGLEETFTRILQEHRIAS